VTKTLLEWSLGGHVAIIVVALTFYKFVFSEIAENVLEKGKMIAKKIEAKIFLELSIVLKPFLDKERTSSIIIVSQWNIDSEEYKEQCIDIQGTEQYKNAIHDFIKSNTNPMLDFRFLKIKIDRCLFWKRYLKKSVTILVGFHLLIVAFEVVCKIYGICSDNKLVLVVLILSSFLTIANCFFPLWPISHYNDDIEDIERLYA